MKSTIFTVLLLATLSGMSARMPAMTGPQDKAGDQISGEWDATFFPSGHTTPFSLEFKLEGQKVKGRVNSAHTGPGTIEEGSWSNNQLQATLKFASHEPILITGTLEQGKLSGEFRTEGFVAKWEAARKVEKTTKAVDFVSGEWEASFVSEDKSIAFARDLSLRLEGNKVTGTFNSDRGSGTIEGERVNEEIRLVLTSSAGSMIVNGTLNNGKLVGTWDVGHAGGPWEATRK